MESAADGLEPFEALSGIKVELVPIPDDSLYDKVLAEFISGTASFDALQFFSPWLGDFAAPGFLTRLDDFAEKWKLPLEDFYDTYRLNYGYFGDKGLFGIPFDCDIQMVYVRKSLLKQVTGQDVDTKLTVTTYDEMIRLSGELNKIEKGVAGVGLMAGRGFWSTYTWEHIAAQYGVDLFNDEWEPIFNVDAGVKALETTLALSESAAEGIAGWGWPENRKERLHVVGGLGELYRWVRRHHLQRDRVGGFCRVRADSAAGTGDSTPPVARSDDGRGKGLMPGPGNLWAVSVPWGKKHG